MKIYEGNLITPIEDYQGKWALSPCGNVTSGDFNGKEGWFIIEPLQPYQKYVNGVLIEDLTKIKEDAIQKIKQDFNIKQETPFDIGGFKLRPSWKTLYNEMSTALKDDLVPIYTIKSADEEVSIQVDSNTIRPFLKALAEKANELFTRKHTLEVQVNASTTKEQIDQILLENNVV